MLHRVGVALVWIGFLSGALISVRHQEEIAWVPYGVAVAVTIAGIAVVRITARRSAEQDGQTAREGASLRENLGAVDDGIRTLLEQREEIPVYDVHDRIDADLMPPIARFVDARESMIAAYGIDTYAKVMTDFALAERLLNRAWCASADGYIDEVWASIGRAAEAIGRARTALPDS